MSKSYLDTNQLFSFQTVSMQFRKHIWFLPIVAFLMFGNVSLAFAHGEDKSGPHGGQIQMPGAFHTEVLQDSNGAIRIYLLDISFQHPITNNSSVVVSAQDQDSNHKLSCSPKDNYFNCISQSSKTLNSGKLLIDAIRDGMKGVPAVYSLPLRTPRHMEMESDTQHEDFNKQTEEIQ